MPRSQVGLLHADPYKVESEEPAELQGSERWMTLLDSGSPDHLAVLDPDFTVVWRSGPVGLEAGAGKAGSLQHPTALIHPDDLTPLMQAVNAARAQPGECIPVSFRSQTRAGTGWIECDGWLAALDHLAAGHLMLRFRIHRNHPVGWTGGKSSDPFLALMDGAALGLGIGGGRGVLGYRNPAFRRWFPADEVLNLHDMAERAVPEEREQAREWVGRLLAGEDATVTLTLQDGYETRRLRLDGFPRPMGEFDLSIGVTLNDITEQVEARESLRQVIDLVPHLIYAVDADGRVRFANRATADFLGEDVEQLTGRRLAEAISDGVIDDILEATREAIHGEEAIEDLEDQVTAPDGMVHHLRTSLIPYRAAGSGRPTLLGVSTDVTRAVTSEVRFAELEHHMPDLALIVDADGRRRFVSHAVVDLLGWTPEEFIELGISDTVHPEDQQVIADVWARSGPGVHHLVELRYRHRDGSWRWFEVKAVDLCDVPAIGGMLMFGRDISERKERDLLLHHEATHDQLSGVLNRSAVIGELEVALTEARADGSSVGVLFCDLDNFKLVNDGLGHDVGDKLLQRISHCMVGSLRHDDVVGRLGGDEFLVVVRDVGDEQQLMALAERVSMSVAEDLRGTPFPVSLSIGAAFAERGAATTGELVRDADAAMYRAKSSGKARTELFRADMRDQAERRLQVGRLLRNALDDGRLTVHYQPIFTLVDGRWRLHALEALARCPLADGSMLSPEEFIPVAEQTGMIARLGRRVTRLACEDLARWSRDHAGVRVWLNVSVQELERRGLPDQYVATLEQHGLAPDQIGIEVTESAMVRGRSAAMASLAELRDLGMTVVVDDFGTGYSSLGALKHYPADVVKVDRGFISGVVDQPADLAIVRAVVDIGTVMGVDVVAEGVESAEEMDVLSTVGCTGMQGYHLARPMPADRVAGQLGQWLTGWVAPTPTPTPT